MLRGQGHRVIFSIYELEAVDAVEQMVEEMADENMNWLSAIDTVAKLRRGHYSRQASLYYHIYSKICVTFCH